MKIAPLNSRIFKFVSKILSEKLNKNVQTLHSKREMVNIAVQF